MQLVTVTSQGQISIPAKMRRELGLDKTRKAIVRKEKDRIIIEPVTDLMDFEGSLAKYAIKGRSADEIIKMEEEAVAEAAADDYRRSLKRQSVKNLPK